MSEKITKILVPVDFSLHAERAFGYAATMAQRFGASIGLVHVIEDPFVTGAWNADVFVPNIREFLDALTDNAQRHLNALKESATKLGVKAETAVITGRPAHAIVEHAKEGGFNLIVMATHGRTGLSHVFLGSVAEQVVRKAVCPVLTVRTSDTPGAGAGPAAA